MILTRRSIIVLSAAALGACALRPSSMDPGTRIILFRHGDRDGEDLNAQGRARAALLPDVLEGIQIDAIYSPDLQRNLDTVAPLAAARGLTVQTLPRETVAQDLPVLAAGRSVVWVGNSDNLVDIWDNLGLGGSAPVGYGDMAIVEAGADGQPTVMRLRFGPDA